MISYYDDMTLTPIGVIHSDIRARADMPNNGVNAEVEIFKEYKDALDGIDGHSHIFVLCWLHEADRSLLKATPRKISETLPEKGVFSMRSPSRPNPVSVSVVRLYRRNDRILYVEGLDVINGTPVIDIKPYQLSGDCVFSAKNPDKSAAIKKMMPNDYKDGLIREAVNYHGEKCIGVAIAVRMASFASHNFGKDLHDPDICIVIGKNPCITDSLIGITGAKLGDKRLLYNLNPKLTLSNDIYSMITKEKTIIFKIKKFMKDFYGILECDINELFTIEII